VKFVLDTNVVSALMKGEPRVVQRLRQIRKEEVSVPQPVLAEITYGIERLPESKRRRVLQELFDLVRSELARTSWTDEVSESFGSIKAALERQGRRIEDFDAAIAAHALARALFWSLRISTTWAVSPGWWSKTGRRSNPSASPYFLATQLEIPHRPPDPHPRPRRPTLSTMVKQPAWGFSRAPRRSTQRSAGTASKARPCADSSDQDSYHSRRAPSGRSPVDTGQSSRVAECPLSDADWPPPGR
jgi:tRNA(fMet)-specific endonuclease VapC